jgi:16S rRNA (cytidine1402-2'-O)-methyltransferase
VSDPGYRLVTAAIAAGIPVVPVPGASAVLGALAAAGLPTEAFRFCGFLPAKTGQRKKALEALRGEDCTLVFYEAPHRILDALADLAAVYGDRPVVVARELTKLHEEFLRGTVVEVRQALASRDSVRGEITLLVQAPAERPASGAAGASKERIADRVARIGAEAGVDEKEALKRLARELGQSKSELYRELQRERARIRAR